MSRFLFHFIFVLGAGLVTAGFAYDSSAPTSQNQVCTRFATDAGHQISAQMMSDTSNRLSFANPAGTLHTGLCWWYSRFERAAAYLAYYNPGADKPSDDQATQIATKIAHFEGPVEIPGYSDLADFSQDYQAEIASVMSDWEFREWGPSALSADPHPSSSLASGSGRLPNAFETAGILDEMLNVHHVIPYVLLAMHDGAHSWLITEVTPHYGDETDLLGVKFKSVVAYDISATDSNFVRGDMHLTITPGEDTISANSVSDDDGNLLGKDWGDTDFKMYSAALGDLDAIDAQLQKKCGTSAALYPPEESWGFYHMGVIRADANGIKDWLKGLL